MNLLRSAVSENDAGKFVVNNNNNHMISKLNNSHNNSNSIPITKPHSLGFERTTDVFGEVPTTSLQESIAPNNTNSNTMIQKRFTNNNNNSNNHISNNNNSNNTGSVMNLSWDSSVLNAAWKAELPLSESMPSNSNYNPRSSSSSGGANATPNRNVNKSRSNSANTNGGMNNHNIANNNTNNTNTTTQIMSNLSKSSTWSNFSVITPMNWLLVFRADIQRVLDEGRCRDLSLNEVIVVALQIYYYCCYYYIIIYYYNIQNIKLLLHLYYLI